MTLTGTWINNRAGILVLKWTAGEVPVRHRHKPHRPRIGESRHND